MPVTPYPQVGIALSRWVNAARTDNWSTTAPVVDPLNTTTHTWNNEPYTYDSLLGYMLTEPNASYATTEMEDCVVNPPGTTTIAWPWHEDHMLTWNGTCVAAGYTRLRTAGWLFQTQQLNTVPIYGCFNSTLGQHFISNQANCEGKGGTGTLFGYAIAQGH